MLLLRHLKSNKFRILDPYDFIVMGSDGLFDKQSNSEIIRTIFKQAVDMYKNKDSNINQIAHSCSEGVVKNAISNKALDNISWNIIFFDNFISFLNGRPLSNLSSQAFEMTLSPKKSEGLAKMSSHLNYDLTDEDLDKTHSSKSIEYMLNGLKKQNIINEGHQNIEKNKYLGNKLIQSGQNLFIRTTKAEQINTG